MATVKLSGVGMHSGIVTNMTIKPTKYGGIVFIRNGVRMQANYNNIVVAGLRNSSIGCVPNNVQTIEHLMAALFICGIVNAEIKMDNPEVPIMDGGINGFVKALKSIKEPVKTPILRVKREVIVRQSELRLPLWLRLYKFITRTNRNRDAFVRLSPLRADVLDISAEIDFKVPVIGRQKYSFKFDYADFKKSAARFMKEVGICRTFGTESEFEWLKKHGMGRGANGGNVLAVNQAGDDTLNDLFYNDPVAKARMIEKYGDMFAKGGKPVRKHFKDEFVRHKILDAVGDIYTSGFRISGKLELVKSGHGLNNLLLKKLFKDPANYDIIA